MPKLLLDAENIPQVSLELHQTKSRTHGHTSTPQFLIVTTNFLDLLLRLIYGCNFQALKRNYCKSEINGFQRRFTVFLFTWIRTMIILIVEVPFPTQRRYLFTLHTLRFIIIKYNSLKLNVHMSSILEIGSVLI